MPHQKEGVYQAAIKKDLYLAYEVGCLSWDTKIPINRGGKASKVTIEHLYRIFNGTELASHITTLDHSIPTKVRGVKNDIIQLLNVVRVWRSGVKPMYSLKLNNASIKATADHMFLTKRGWVKLQDLDAADMVAVDTITKWKKKAVKKNRQPSIERYYKQTRVGKYHKYGRVAYEYHTGLKKIHYLVAEHRLVYEAYLNNMSIEDFIAATHTQNKLIFLDPKQYHIHHADTNKRNNELSNLECLKPADHFKEHGNHKHFGHGEIAWRGIKSIEFVGEEICYDIEVEAPYSNFVANGIVVHNCGKTPALINILRQRYSDRGALENTLILAPVIVLKQWKKEFERFSKIPQGAIEVLDGTVAKRLKKLAELKGPRIVITNYDIFQNKDVVLAFKKWGPKFLVCDEAHTLKNYKSKRAKGIAEIADLCEHRYLLSGTPVLNNAMDLFMQFRILDGYLGSKSTFGKNFFSFRHEYFEDQNSMWAGKQGYFPKYIPRATAYKRLTQKIDEKTLRVLKKDVLKDLPPMVEEEALVELGVEQQKLYNEMKKNFVAFVKDSLKIEDRAVVARLAVTKALRLQEILSGYAKIEDGEVYRIKENPRIEKLKELLTTIDSTHKIIIWAIFKENYAQIREVCDELGLKYTEIHGDIPNKEKFKNVDYFNNDPECRILIGNPASGGVGVNLIAASYSIYYTRSFKLSDELQSEARNYRKGSEIHEKITKIKIMAPGTLDEIIDEAINGKAAIGERILDRIGDL